MKLYAVKRERDGVVEWWDGFNGIWACDLSENNIFRWEIADEHQRENGGEVVAFVPESELEAVRQEAAETRRALEMALINHRAEKPDVDWADYYLAQARAETEGGDS